MSERTIYLGRRFAKTTAALALMLAVAVGCNERPGEQATDAMHSGPERSASTIAASAPSGGDVAPPVVDDAEMKAVHRLLEGGWRVESSSGDERGHVFRERIGERVDFDGDTLSFPAGASDGSKIRKTVRVVRGQAPVQLKLDHRGHFRPDDKPGADAAARRSPNSKGWSRHALVRVDRDTMTLALEFPQNGPPKDFAIDTRTVEVVILARIR